MALPPERKAIFDREAATLCLLLRKEFGQQKFIEFIKNNSSQNALHQVYGFNGYSQFDESFKRYFYNLSQDIVNNRTPDNYLKINGK